MSLAAVGLVGVGGAAGAVARHLVGLRIEGRASVLAVNALGSLLLGTVLAAPVGSAATAAVGVGFCGAFTTFSSFAVETVRTAERGDHAVAARFAVVILFASLAGFVVGVLVAAALLGGSFA